MTLIFLTTLGGLAGLLADQIMICEERQDTRMTNVLMGALGAAIGGWLMLPAMGAAGTFLGAALGAGLMLSIANLVRRRGIP